MTPTPLAAPDADRCWTAVQARDPRADGSFVYAVRSTRIYCRPSCPSRRPRRAQVVFFPRPEAAEAAGFRACRRCRPGGAAPADPGGAIARAVCAAIDAGATPARAVAQAAAGAGVGAPQVRRRFTAALGITPRQYAEARRMDGLRRSLRAGPSITAAMYDAGMGSSSRLYERSDSELGMTPAAYRHGGAGVRIAYTIQDSPLGRLLVAATARGVCAVSLGDADAPLEAALAGEYPSAVTARDDAVLGPAVQAILAHLRGETPRIDLPVDVQATAFQRRVWRALRAIPAGETRSYGQVARAIGRPGAARAVARACAANPVSLIVPCHRVVRGDGAPSGYRWGAARRAALLDAERARLLEADDVDPRARVGHQRAGHVHLAHEHVGRGAQRHQEVVGRGGGGDARVAGVHRERGRD